MTYGTVELQNLHSINCHICQIRKICILRLWADENVPLFSLSGKKFGFASPICILRADENVPPLLIKLSAGVF